MENIVFLNDSLPMSLRRLKIEMKNLQPPSGWPPSRAKFRGKLCGILRKHNELSLEEICIAINSHPRAMVLREKYLGFRMEYPIAPSFLELFEGQGDRVMDYCTQGLFFGIGFPTQELTELICEICQSERELKDFSAWSDAFLKFTPWTNSF